MRRRRLLLAAVAVAALGLLGAGRLLTARPISLPVLGALPAFHLADERGAQVTRDTMRGSIAVIDFIFTSCGTACPILSTELGKLQEQLRGQGIADRVRLWSISVDPERDTAERLRAFAARYGADPQRWRFLRGDEHEIRSVVVDGMKQEVARQIDRGEADGFTILHGTKLVLVDAEGRIRGYYDARDEARMTQLRAHLTALADGRVGVEAPALVTGAPF